ncbi:unnamed protein product [Chrysoparadoxa australica]
MEILTLLGLINWTDAQDNKVERGSPEELPRSSQLLDVPFGFRKEAPVKVRFGKGLARDDHPDLFRYQPKRKARETELWNKIWEVVCNDLDGLEGTDDINRQYPVPYLKRLARELFVPGHWEGHPFTFKEGGE